MTDLDSNDPADILARTIWGEARGEGAIGMHAVANVIMNRVAQPGWWGTDIASVCQHPWQFSCWNVNDSNREKLLTVNHVDPQYDIAVTIATAAATGALPDITMGATGYYNPEAVIHTPSWAINKTPCAHIGHHLFFN